MAGPVRLGHDRVDGPADQLVGPPTEDSLGGIAGRLDDPVGVDRDDRVERR